jgi:hypothetical protein
MKKKLDSTKVPGAAYMYGGSFLGKEKGGGTILGYLQNRRMAEHTVHIWVLYL